MHPSHLLFVFTLLTPLLALAAAIAAPGSEADDREPFLVTGYLLDANAVRADGTAIPLDPDLGRCLTDLIYFSLQPQPDGSLAPAAPNPELMEQLRRIRQEHGTRLLVSVGGWERSGGFAGVVREPSARARFIRALLRYCREHDFAGVDLDWEFPEGPEQEAEFARLLVDLKAVLQPEGLLLTSALAYWQKLPPEAFAALDRVHLMSYDHYETGEPMHATFERAQSDVQAMQEQGVPPEKILLGVPFYGRDTTGQGRDAMTYAQIARRNHPAPDADFADGFGFNGPETIQRKTRWAAEQGLGGVMIWEITQDLRSTDPASLLAAIRRAVPR